MNNHLRSGSLYQSLPGLAEPARRGTAARAYPLLSNASSSPAPTSITSLTRRGGGPFRTLTPLATTLREPGFCASRGSVGRRRFAHGRAGGRLADGGGGAPGRRDADGALVRGKNGKVIVGQGNDGASRSRGGFLNASRFPRRKVFRGRRRSGFLSKMSGGPRSRRWFERIKWTASRFEGCPSSAMERPVSRVALRAWNTPDYAPLPQAGSGDRNDVRPTPALSPGRGGSSALF